MMGNDFIYHRKCCCLPFEHHNQRLLKFNNINHYAQVEVIYNDCYIRQLFEDERIKGDGYNYSYHKHHVYYNLAREYVMAHDSKDSGIRGNNGTVHFYIMKRPFIHVHISFVNACEIFMNGSTNHEFLESFEQALKNQLQYDYSAIPKSIKKKHEASIKRMNKNMFDLSVRHELIDMLCDVMKYRKAKAKENILKTRKILAV